MGYVTRVYRSINVQHNRIPHLSPMATTPRDRQIRRPNLQRSPRNKPHPQIPHQIHNLRLNLGHEQLAAPNKRLLLRLRRRRRQ